ncbi:MAG: TlpA disulfide reductase family protein, partial [Chitinophagales bacterium]
ERRKQLDFYNKSNDKSLFSDSFKKFMENMIRYHYYARLLSYPAIQANQSAQILTVKAFPEVMIKGIDAKLVNDEALIAESYRDFLNYYSIYFTSKSNGFKKFTDASTSMESKVLTATRDFSGESLNWYLAWFLNKEMNKVSQYTAGHIYTVLGLKENNGTYTQLLKKKVKERLAVKDVAAAKENGKASPANSESVYPKLKDMDGKYFTFDDLKGKVVYVDYWASWCGPCRTQMPYSKQLHDMFTPQQQKQIVFLYISIDQSEDAWKNAAKQLAIEGKQGISPGNWQSQIATYFQINSIPWYMLIDKKGNIVDLNAKRPSLGKDIYDDILKLLQ